MPHLIPTAANSADYVPRRNRNDSPAGVAATELALVLPLVLLLALASADFGRIAHYYQVVSNAARTAAETGAMQQFTASTRGAWESKMRTAAVEELETLPHFDEGELTFTVETSVDADGIVRVAVDVGYPFRAAVEWPTLPSEVTLHRRNVFRQFR